MNEKMLKVAVVVALILGGTSGTLVTMNSNQVQYADLMSDFQALTEDFTGVQADYGSLLNDYGNLTEDYGILAGEFDSLNQSYYALLEDYNTLSVEFDDLNQTYYTLVTDYDALQALYDSLNGMYAALYDEYLVLLDAYTILLEQYDTLTTWIGQQILPVQCMVFAEAVRRYYFEDFYVQDTTPGSAAYWSEFTRFCRDVVMHDSWDLSEINGLTYYNPFVEVSNILEPALQYDSIYLSFITKWATLWSAGQNHWWGNFDMTGDALTDISNIVQECNDMIDYELDTDITTIHDYAWDYIKFPVETLFRQAGDCEDQAILAAAYLESCGFETMMVTIHDPDYSTGGLYHGVPMVFWNQTAWGPLPSGFKVALRFGGAGVEYYDDGWWMFLDTTWDTPFPIGPSWLDWYLTQGGGWFDYTKFTYAVCDYDGWVSVPFGGAGSTIEVSMP